MLSPSINGKVSALAIALGSAALATAAFAPSADAFTLTYDSAFGSTNNPSTGASAQVDFSFTQDGNDVLLQLDVTNTTNGESIYNTLNGFSTGDADYVANGGADTATLMGFGFDVTDDFDDINYSYETASSNFSNFFDGDARLTGNSSNEVLGSGVVNGYRFDLGFGLNNSANNIGGGNPNGGLTAGNSTSLVLRLSGSNLDAMALETALENAYKTNALAAGARFQQVGVNGDTSGSDKIGGGYLEASPIPDNPSPPKSVPEPSLMLGVGLVGAALLKRKQNQDAAALAIADH